MEDLKKYRSIIDIIDKEMIRLFEQRMVIAHKIGEVKKKKGIVIYNEEREQEIIRRCITYLNDQDYKEETATFLKGMMNISVKHQLRQIEEQ